MRVLDTATIAQSIQTLKTLTHTREWNTEMLNSKE